MKLSTIFITVPVGLTAIVFAVANRHWVKLSADPFSPDAPVLSMEVPLYGIVFAALALGMILGGVAVWFGQGRWRNKARTGARELRKLQNALPPAQSGA